MINIVGEKRQACCGCSACEQICPQRCIEMLQDEEGFLYPVVKEENCTKCNLCEKVCPILQKETYYDKDAEMPKTVGGWHKVDEVREKSSSGGAFTLFAEYILEQKGIVYGCTLNEQNEAIHISVENIIDLDKLRGSKYVQSNINEVYKEIRKHLSEGRKILFVGTPCQAAGLHSFLRGEEWENLYICDFICHGVPSPKIFKSYIKSQEKKFNDKIIVFKFRNKDVPWSSSGMQKGTKMVFQNGTVVRLAPAYKDTFMNGFLDDLYLRPSCYKCEFKSLPKYYADITIADFWGVSHIDKELNDRKGTSLLLFNSIKGKELFHKVEKNFFYKECKFDKAIWKNKSLIKSAKWNKNRNQFFEEYAALPFEKVQKKHMNAFKWGIHKVLNLGWNLIETIIKLCLSPILNLLHIKWTEEKWSSFMQFIKFAMVGVSNSAVSYTINITVLFLLSDLHLAFDYVIANLTGFSLSVLWSFFWNNRYVFTLKQGEKRSRKRTLLKTYLAYGFSGIFLNNALSTMWIHGLGLSRYLAPLLNLPISVPVNFIMNKLWAYRVKDK